MIVAAFLAAAMTIATAQLSMAALAQVSGPKLAHLPSVKAGTNVSFASLKQIDAGLLNVGYAEAGSIDGPPVVLLHGWPYDIHTASLHACGSLTSTVSPAARVPRRVDSTCHAPGRPAALGDPTGTSVTFPPVPPRLTSCVAVRP